MKFINISIIFGIVFAIMSCSTLTPVVKEQTSSIRFIGDVDKLSAEEKRDLTKELNKIIYQAINEDLTTNIERISIKSKIFMVNEVFNTENKETKKELILLNGTLDINASYQDSRGLRSIDGLPTVPLMVGKFKIKDKTSLRFNREELKANIKKQIVQEWNKLTP